jgi:hypothetical protein
VAADHARGATPRSDREDREWKAHPGKARRLPSVESMACQVDEELELDGSGAVSRALYVLVTSRLLYEGDPAWFTSVFARASRLPRDIFTVAYAAASRRIERRGPVVLTHSERSEFRRIGFAPPPEGWELDECARASLLIEVARVSRELGAPAGPRAVARLVGELVTRNVAGEQKAALKALAYMPDARSLLEVAYWAARSGAVDVFDAIAFENPYPAQHFGDGAFDALVIRAIALGRDVNRIVGVGARMSPDLLALIPPAAEVATPDEAA